MWRATRACRSIRPPPAACLGSGGPGAGGSAAAAAPADARSVSASEWGRWGGAFGSAPAGCRRGWVRAPLAAVCPLPSASQFSTTAAGPAPPGLFGLDGLSRPEDFRDLTVAAVEKCGQLVKRIVTKDARRRQAAASNGGVPLPWSYDEALSLLDDLDAISYTLCDVVDTAELTRQAHAKDAFRRSADDMYHGLSEVLSQLSSHAGLYWAICSLTDDTEFFAALEPEHHRMATMLQREFERDGIHLPESDQKKSDGATESDHTARDPFCASCNRRRKYKQ